MWKIDKYFDDQPEMFREPTEMSDSGVSSQSTFSGLQSEEGEGNYYCGFLSLKVW